MSEAPVAIMLAGPNGAGKTTTALTLFRNVWRSFHYVNADTIAQGLSDNKPESVALEAGAIMLRRLRDLGNMRQNLAFESTGAARSFAPWLRGLIQQGYEVCVCWVRLQSPDMAVARVAQRVRSGGHAIPEETVRRRFLSGWRNFEQLYRPIAHKWLVVDNSKAAAPTLDDSSGDVEFGTTVLNSLQSAAKKAVRWHRFLGNPIAASRDGKLVEIPPAEIVIDEDPRDNSQAH